MGLLHLKYCQEESPLLPFLLEEAALDMLCVLVVLQLCPALLPRWGLTRQDGLCATAQTCLSGGVEKEKKQSLLHRGTDKQ